MTFDEAASFRMPLGKHKGKMLDSIAASAEGLKYLDWLIGQDWLRDPLRAAVWAYMGDESIQRELEALGP